MLKITPLVLGLLTVVLIAPKSQAMTANASSAAIQKPAEDLVAERPEYRHHRRSEHRHHERRRDDHDRRDHHERKDRHGERHHEHDHDR